MIGKILFLGLLVSQVKPRSIGSLTQRNCPSTGHLLLPHESDNTKFYYCEWGSKKEPPSTCAAGTVFSFRLQSCDWPWNVEVENDNEEGDSYAIEEDSEDNTNNDDGGKIDDINDVPADNDENFPNGCPIDFTIHRLLIHKNNCNKYYYCVAGKTILKRCSPGLYFNPDISVCDWPKNVNCKSNETNDSKDENLDDEGSNNDENNDDENNSIDRDEGEDLPNGCPANFTIYRLLPHESDCRKFYYCVFGETVSRNCPSGLYFNPNGSICDWPWNVNCKIDGPDDDESDDESDSGVDDDEDNGDSEEDDGGDDTGSNEDDDTGENEDSDDSEGGGDEEGNEVDGGDGGRVKKKLEVVAEVIIRIKKRHQLKQIYSRREHKIIRSSPTIAGLNV